MYVVNRGVQERCPLPGNQQLKPRNLVQVECEHCQPVVQPVVCDMAESNHLVNGGDQRRITNVVVQVVRNIEPRGTAEDFSGLLTNAVES